MTDNVLYVHIRQNEVRVVKGFWRFNDSEEFYYRSPNWKQELFKYLNECSDFTVKFVFYNAHYNFFKELEFEYNLMKELKNE